MYRRNKSNKKDLPHFELNYELTQLFKNDELVRPTNYDKLTEITKEAFDALLTYKHREYALTASSYTCILKLLTEVEDVLSQSMFRLENKRLEHLTDNWSNINQTYKLYMDVAKELPQEIGHGDYVILHTMTDAKYFADTLSITKISKTFLEVETSFGCREILEDTLYEVKFERDRTVPRFEQLAIQELKLNFIPRVIFPEVCGEAADLSMEFEWLSDAVKTNPEQQQAVRNIVNGSSFPAPYILFGPPGTGKTTTLVEAIAQVWKIKSNSHILVCTSSNYACNEILTRLMDLDCVPETELFRYFSKSQLQKVDAIEDRILEVSNINKREFEYPRVEELQKYRIIFLTLVTAGRLGLLEMRPNHFDYIFVDEAGSATEASTLIPVASLMSFVGFKRNQLVLAGDPKQLGPIVMHRSAEKLMYGRSMLDRLMELDLYLPDPKTKQYNPACLTKLLQNFRSHKNILDIPNELFYDNQLIAKAKSSITNMALGQPFLPNPKIPIVFHAVFGKTDRDDDNPSLYNLLECYVVLDYVRKVLEVEFDGETVLPKDIGIISPYRRQCTELSKMLQKLMKMTDIEVGSVEQFQGQERKVIILSTVRSFTETIGFLNNPKRFNVSITRAKALLIIIGNPITLQMNKNWFKLLKYCVEHNVCTGTKFELNESVKIQKKLISNPPNPQTNEAKSPFKEQKNAINVLKRFTVKFNGESSSSSSASQTEIEATRSDLMLDKEPLDLQNGESLSLELDLVSNDDLINDDDAGAHVLAAHDTYTSDEKVTDYDESTKANATVTETKPKDTSSDISNLASYFGKLVIN